jgi:hypothetical protein
VKTWVMPSFSPRIPLTFAIALSPYNLISMSTPAERFSR